MDAALYINLDIWEVKVKCLKHKNINIQTLNTINENTCVDLGIPSKTQFFETIKDITPYLK